MTLVCQGAINPGALTSNGHLPFLLVPLIAWRAYYWLRHQTGRQPLRTRRITGRVAFFICLALGYTIVSLDYPRVLAGLGGGLFLGALVAVSVGLRLTRFESTPEGRFYTPNALVGAGLSILLVGRLIYRFIMLHSAPPDFLLKYPGRFQSPLTAFLFGLTAGYYIAYFLGVLLRSRKQEPGR